MTQISSLVVPAVLLIPAILFFSGKRDYSASFIRGAKQGLECALGLIPPLTLIMCAISMFSASGAAGALAKALSPVLGALGVPSECVPLLVTRPFSGSAANAAFAELLARSGADSYPALVASVIMGSSDTTFYIISVYFSAAKSVRKTRYLFPVAVASALFCVFFSCFICRLIY